VQPKSKAFTPLRIGLFRYSSITVELILIFGGPEALTGNPTNPGLIDDNVSANDKEFLTSFPYLAAPF